MAHAEPARVGELADLVGVIERLAGELALAEEPARFLAALEAGAPAPSGSDPEEGAPAGLAAAVRAADRSPVELTETCLERIGRLDARLRAFVRVDADGARRAARAREAEARAGTIRGPLHGTPLAYKDLFAVRGLPTSCGTRDDAYFVTEREATAVARLTALPASPRSTAPSQSVATTGSTRWEGCAASW